MPNPLIEKVLQKFPDVDRNSLVFPTEADDWDEQGLELFIGSGGFLKPKKKPAAAVAPATPVESGVTAAGGGVAPLAPLTKSAWWVNNSNPAAKIRLFCAMGIGNVASTYGPWVSKATAEKFPAVEVCVVELPGHGTNFAEPSGSVTEVADRLEAEIRRCHTDEHGELLPLALYGFSMGANIMYVLSKE